MNNVVSIPRLVVREGRSDDRSSVVALVEKVWQETYTTHLPPAGLQQTGLEFFSQLAGDPGQQGWVAEIGNRLVGYGRVASNCIDQLWVSSSMRRRGIGSALLSQMLASIRERDFGFAQAGCEDFNISARRFLTATGWSLIHSEPQRLNEDYSCSVLVHSIALR